MSKEQTPELKVFAWAMDTIRDCNTLRVHAKSDRKPLTLTGEELEELRKARQHLIVLSELLGKRLGGS